MIKCDQTSFSKKVYSGLKTNFIGKKLYHLETVGSTNSFIKNIDSNDKQEGIVVVADVQSEGRGRKYRKWTSPKGGLWFSILLFPKIHPKQGMLITMIGSIAVSQGIIELTNLNPEIKWPNDILLNKRKVCGILTEIETHKEKMNYVIVGIGINVNNILEKEFEKSATTLKNVFGNQVSREDLLTSILNSFDKNYEKLYSQNYDYIRNLWLSYSNIIGKKIKVEDGKNAYNGVVSDINEYGHLILETSDGHVKVISGDVTYL
jgi:BirA family biotin operon repressor/biotin-[acetyl-CoA-carboxylase] ligase